MRVTERLVFQRATHDAASAREAAEKANADLTRGTRVEHPGDDPATAGLVVAHRMTGERFAAIASATSAAADELEAADSALGNASHALVRAREIAVRFSSAGYSQTEATAASQEVQGLMAQMATALNARVGNRYVFGGSRDAAPPFDANGTYGGDGIAREVEIAPGVRQQANVLVGGMAATADPTQQTAFNALSALRAALATYSTAGVQATLTGLETGMDQVAGARAQAGVAMNAFDAATSAAKLVSDGEEKSESKLNEIDYAAAAVRLQATQTALQATYSAVSQSFRLSLLNYLK